MSSRGTIYETEKKFVKEKDSWQEANLQAIQTFIANFSKFFSGFICFRIAFVEKTLFPHFVQ